MEPNYDIWLQMFNLEKPASSEAIVTFERAAGFALPVEYARFLAMSNGGFGEIGDHYLQFWPVEELLKWNEGYKVAEFAPGLFLFGSDGGGEAFAFDRKQPGLPVVMVPFIPLDRREAVELAPTFDAFLEKLYAEPDLLGAVPQEWDAEIEQAWDDAIAQVAEPYGPGKPGPWNLAQIDAYTEKCREDLDAAQAKLEEVYSLGGYDRYEFDLVQGRLDFPTSETAEVSFKALPIGTWSQSTNTWCWAWGDPSLPEDIAAKLTALESLAKDDEWIFYDRPAYKARLEDAWMMAAIAFNILEGLGVYRCPQDPQLFLLLVTG
jgi:hypothetical protein